MMAMPEQQKNNPEKIKVMKIKNILLLLTVVFAFIACNDDDSTTIQRYEAIVVTPPSLESDTCVLLQENEKDELFSLSWTASEQEELLIGKPTYLVQVDLHKNEFRKAQVLARSTETSATITVEELNNIVNGYFNITNKDTILVDFRVITNYGLGNGVIDSTASNVFSLYITPYVFVEPDMRIPLHLIGNMFGENIWNEKNYTFVMFRSEPGDDTDTYTGKFAAGSEFKFIDNDKLGGWSGLYGSGGAGMLSQDGGAGNITDISAEGYYTVTANIGDLTYTIEEYDATGKAEYTTLGLIGAFNGWSEQLPMIKSTYDPHIWYLDDIELDGELKFRADDSKWWGGATFPYGGGGDANINVTAGKYFVKFNDLTEQYVFYAK